MKYFRDHRYPNGWIKSRLYEVFLTYLDFGITSRSYEQSLEFVKIDERNGEKNCAWYWDESGNLIVADLLFKDRNLQLKITATGFEFTRTSETACNLKVFISYAREDLEQALRLCQALESKGFDAWLDKKRILPGQPWKTAIEEAIRASHFFVALLSTRSVVKRGYVQKEIAIALDVVDTLPPTDIFLIPARLNECHPSHARLALYDRVDLFPEWQPGFERLIRALEARRLSGGWGQFDKEL